MKNQLLSMLFLLSASLGFGSCMKNKISICAIFRDESEYLKEWIEYHQLIGVDHFYLYDNNSQDHPESVLAPYIQKGIVTLMQWPSYVNEDNKMIWALTTQLSAYENAAKYAALGKTEWLTYLDISEFIVPTESNSLKSLLKKYPNASGITFTTECYDGYSIQCSPQKKLVTESTQVIYKPKRSLYKEVEKTIFKPETYSSCSWPPQKLHFINGSKVLHLGKDKLRINLYANRFKGILSHERDRNIFIAQELSPGEKSQILQAGHAIEELSRPIDRFLPQLKRHLNIQDSSP